MTAPATISRNATLEDIVAVLRADQPRKMDVVAPVGALRVHNGQLLLEGTGQLLTPDGVTTTDGVYNPTAICDGGIADKLGIPTAYLSRLRADHLRLYDMNVNGWLQHAGNAGKNYLVRCFRGAADNTRGVARAFLSDSFKPIENLDVLMTVLEGIGAAGVSCEVASADLTDRRMYIKVRSREVAAQAPLLLRNYRSPYTGQTGAENPIVFAGFAVSNSEVGHGAFQIAPWIEIQVCKNGMVIGKQAIRAQHLGQKLAIGEIPWGDDTQEKNLELIGLKTRDAVKAFLDVEWLEREIAKMEASSTVELAHPDDTIKQVTAKLRYSEAQQDDILKMFIRGGDITAGGVMQAVTASAQNQQDADVAWEMENDALRALELAVTYA